jgi:transcriptional regulator
MMKGILGFRLPVDSLEGKFKLGQERSQGDRDGILRGLKGSAPEGSIADLTAKFYSRQK